MGISGNELNRLVEKLSSETSFFEYAENYFRELKNKHNIEPRENSTLDNMQILKLHMISQITKVNAGKIISMASENVELANFLGATIHPNIKDKEFSDFFNLLKNVPEGEHFCKVLVKKTDAIKTISTSVSEKDTMNTNTFQNMPDFPDGKPIGKYEEKKCVGPQVTVIKVKSLKKAWHLHGGMNFEIKEGELVHIIGKSGAGKSILLKMLSGFDKKRKGKNSHTGTLMIKGFLWEENDRELKRIVRYVPQDVSLYGELTPLQILNTYSALFADCEGGSRRSVSKVLELLELNSNENKKIKDLSGGECKRVSIAIELLNCPEILILDEPDSGLDPDNRYALYELLRRINYKEGTTIILSTHYTDGIEDDDRVIMLKTDGSVFFDEAFAQAKERFGGNIENMYRNSNATNTRKAQTAYDTEDDGEFRFFALLKREFNLCKGNLKILSIVSIVCMMFLTNVSSAEKLEVYGKGIAIVFAISCAAILIGLMLSINMVCKDREMIRRELRKGVSSKSIIFSKTMLILFMCIINTLILVAPYIIKLNWYMYLATLVTMFTSAEIGLLVSAFPQSSPQRAAFSIPFIMLFQILFSGFVFTQERLELHNFSISSYSIRTIGSAVLKFDNFDTFDIPSEVTLAFKYLPLPFMEIPFPYPIFSKALGYAAYNLGILFIFFLVFMIMSMVCLRKIDKA